MVHIEKGEELTSAKRNITPKQIPVKKDPGSPFWERIALYSKNSYFFPVVIFLLCLLLYGNTVYNNYALDDGMVIVNNGFVVKGFSAFKDIFDKASLYSFNHKNSGSYRPLTMLNFMAEVSLFGLNPHISHFFNVLFFAFTVVLLYFFLQKILKNYNRTIIIAATLLFAFHPIHTEVVANIKSRDEILGLLFGLLSFYFIILYRDKKKVGYYLFSLLSFFAALFCKENALTFVAVIPLLLYFFTSLEMKKIGFQALPYAGLAAIYLLIRSHLLEHITFATKISVIQNALVAARNSSETTATSFVLMGKYIYMTIVPYPLSYDYSYNQIPLVSWTSFKTTLSLLVCVFLVGYMFWGARKKSIFSFLIAFFFITLFLSSNLIIHIGATFGERFLYVPSLSFCIVLPILIANAMKLNPVQLAWKKRNYFYVPIMGLLIIYVTIVIPRNTVWKDNYTLFSSGVVTAPNSGLTHSFLGGLFLDSAQHAENLATHLPYYSLAEREFKKAIEIYPVYAEWYYNLGVCYLGKGNPDSAILAYKKALQADSTYFLAANNLGVVYLKEAQYDSALSYLFMSYKTDTDLYALLNIGECYKNKNNYGLAFHFDSLALKKVPNNSLALGCLSILHNTVAIQYVNNNELDEALEEFSLALHCDSNSVGNLENIGAIYQRKGNIEMAKYYFQRALSKDPNNEVFKRNLQALNAAH